MNDDDECPDCDESPCVCDADDHEWSMCGCARCASVRANRGVPDPPEEDGLVYRL